MGSTGTSIERNYGLEKILHRIRGRVWLPLSVWLPLVRDADARCASGSTGSLSNRSRVQAAFPVACFGKYRDGFLPDASMRSLRSGRPPRFVCASRAVFAPRLSE